MCHLQLLLLELLMLLGNLQCKGNTVQERGNGWGQCCHHVFKELLRMHHLQPLEQCLL